MNFYKLLNFKLAKKIVSRKSLSYSMLDQRLANEIENKFRSMHVTDFSANDRENKFRSMHVTQWICESGAAPSPGCRLQYDPVKSGLQVREKVTFLNEYYCLKNKDLEIYQSLDER